MRVEGGDSEVDGESEESGGSGDGNKAVAPAILLRHFDGVAFTFRHRYQTAIGIWKGGKFWWRAAIDFSKFYEPADDKLHLLKLILF